MVAIVSEPYTKEIHDQVLARIDELTDKRVKFTVREGANKFDMKLRPETTVGEVKARLAELPILSASLWFWLTLTSWLGPGCWGCAGA